VAIAAPVHAQADGGRISGGYAYARVLDDEDEDAPVGAYLTAHTLDEIGFEAELGYHRYSVDFFNTTFNFNTVTALVGPRFAFGEADAQPFIHLLVGGHFAWADDDNDFAMGGAVGGGLDLQLGDGLFLRMGADLQLFVNDDDTFKVMRLTAGLAGDL
jgi:hypothetical protein